MLGNDLGVCKAIIANGIWDGEILTDFVPTIGGVSLAEALAFMKAAGGAPLNVVVDCMVWAGLEYGYFQLYNYGCALVKSVLRTLPSCLIQFTINDCVAIRYCLGVGMNFLEACSISVELRRTKWVHCSAIRGGSAPEVEIGTALLDTSFKCGAINASSKVFDQMLQESIVSRSAMIVAYGMHVSVQNALVLLAEMKLQVLMPDAVTILSVIQM
ncbi:hypothetical protein GIB67_012165 [Kingdonia uniflora]|uniref:Pentatricopeptide repeat-containing protein n=1 Tax=Kingdonia uniflora TaxID=39325 RepID=A0A7J7NNG6_9MAGN|nr:hypothetical protein GIB67_012165 [Kingdonia uniflora]